MKIIVKESGGKTLRLLFPSCLVFNGISAAIAAAAMKQRDIQISRQQLLSLFRTINNCKRTYKKWKLVELQSHEGDFVEIIL